MCDGLAGSPPVGLQNRSNVCFLNSALQALAACDVYVQWVLDICAPTPPKQREAAQSVEPLPELPEDFQLFGTTMRLLASLGKRIIAPGPTTPQGPHSSPILHALVSLMRALGTCNQTDAPSSSATAGHVRDLHLQLQQEGALGEFGEEQDAVEALEGLCQGVASEVQRLLLRQHAPHPRQRPQLPGWQPHHKQANVAIASGSCLQGAAGGHIGRRPAWAYGLAVLLSGPGSHTAAACFAPPCHVPTRGLLASSVVCSACNGCMGTNHTPFLALPLPVPCTVGLDAAGGLRVRPGCTLLGCMRAFVEPQAMEGVVCPRCTLRAAAAATKPAPAAASGGGLAAAAAAAAALPPPLLGQPPSPHIEPAANALGVSRPPSVLPPPCLLTHAIRPAQAAAVHAQIPTGFAATDAACSSLRSRAQHSADHSSFGDTGLCSSCGSCHSSISMRLAMAAALAPSRLPLPDLEEQELEALLACIAEENAAAATRSHPSAGSGGLSPQLLPRMRVRQRAEQLTYVACMPAVLVLHLQRTRWDAACVTGPSKVHGHVRFPLVLQPTDLEALQPSSNCLPQSLMPAAGAPAAGPSANHHDEGCSPPNAAAAKCSGGCRAPGAAAVHNLGRGRDACALRSWRQVEGLGSAPGARCLYHLRAVLMHLGQAGGAGGHWVAYRKSNTQRVCASLGKPAGAFSGWFRASDQSVVAVCEAEVLASHATALVYERHSLETAAKTGIRAEGTC